MMDLTIVEPRPVSEWTSERLARARDAYEAMSEAKRRRPMMANQYKRVMAEIAARRFEAGE